MLRTVVQTGDMYAYLEVHARADVREIVVSVKAYGLGNPIIEFYPANSYGKALDRFEKIKREMLERQEERCTR